MRRKHNLKVYNQILNRNIQQVKQDYFQNEFQKFKKDTKKTWDVIKSILKNTTKKEFPNFFKIDNVNVTNKREIAERFNRFFTNI